MILLLWPVNFAISWFNARAVGSVWDAAKAKGGWAYFLNWMGAVMSASGFTWCYLLVLGLIGSVMPMSMFVEAKAGEPAVTGMLLEGDTLQAFFDLGYLVIIFPILGSGLAITVETWRNFARNKNRGVGDYAITGWNTFAQISNTYSAFRHVPGVLGSLGAFFGKGSKGSSSGDSKDRLITLVVGMVLFAVLGGILTTYGIVQARRRDVYALEYDMANGRYGSR